MWRVLESWIDRYFGDEEAVLLSILIVLVLVLMIYIGEILAPFFASVVFAFLLQGGVNRLVRVGMPYKLAVYLMFLCFTGLVLLSLFLLLPILFRQSSNLVAQIPGMVKHLQEVVLQLPEKYPEFLSETQLNNLLSYASDQLAGFGESLLSFSFANLPGLIGVIVYLVLVPLMVFFLLKDKDHLLALMSDMLPSRRPVLQSIWHEMNLQIGNYVRGKAIEIVIVGVAAYICFLVLGLDYAALLALVVGLSVLIPYIGAAVVTIPVLMVGYFQWDWGSQLLWLAVVYTVLQFLDGNVLAVLRGGQSPSPGHHSGGADFWRFMGFLGRFFCDSSRHPGEGALQRLAANRTARSGVIT